jgi:hypothetical protein
MYDQKDDVLQDRNVAYPCLTGNKQPLSKRKMTRAIKKVEWSLEEQG